MKGNKKWSFALMDDETRFWISQQVADYKGNSDIRPMMIEAKVLTSKQPKVVVSDREHNFWVAIVEKFLNARHDRDIRFDGSVHNNKMEA